MQTKSGGKFEKLSIKKLIYHHFQSGERMDWDDQQLSIAFATLANSNPTTAEEKRKCFNSIIEALSSLPWPTCPKDVTEQDVSTYTIQSLVRHFFDSGLSSEVADMQLTIADKLINSHKGTPNLQLFQTIVKEIENAESEWLDSL